MFSCIWVKCSVDVCRVIISVISLISLLSFCLVVLSIWECGLLKSPMISVWGLMCDLSFCNISFIYVGALLFGI